MDLGLRPRRSLHPVWPEITPKYVNEASVYHLTDYNNTNVNRPKIKEKRDRMKQFRKETKKFYGRAINSFDRYCQNSTLHGLKYVGDENISTTERLFWLLAFISAICFSTYFITSLYTKFNNSPVIISFSPTPVTLDTIPFPAITICNVNIATKMSAERILNFGSEVDKRLLSDMCNLNNSFSNETDEDTADWKTVRKFIIKINQRCDEMFKICRWENKDIDCKFFINSVLTDEGYCCSFNRLPSNYSLRQTADDMNETFYNKRVDWNPEVGYPPDADADVLPKRSYGAGSHLGLTLVLDADLAQYYCSSTSSTGFKALISSPIESPKVADFGFLIPPGDETRVTIEPIIMDATKGIKGIDIKKRQCFFNNERYLQFYRLYSERNCKLECQANFTLNLCGCIPYYLPKNMSTKICDKKKEECSNRAKYIIEKYTKERRECNCLPSCFDINYTKKGYSMGKITKKYNSTVNSDIMQNATFDYFAENMAVVHFFFSNDKFIKQTKSELYGFSEFLSNTGGLLGLFLGFSFLSAIEIFYFIFLKTSCSFYKKERNKRDMKPISKLPFLQ
ncbi:PREDICTED: pickpocket protein 28-like [Nicrophorus vespilloides]|uniref:Pickpocket protein 28-like n=1 Tax=Nicrophorus vespilloides TaxID=110193 RepID=A0ABM1N961_NICVS|nr:PREDICTED: pickpocket protein 28-like [Nicrophorus vespilloides]